MCVICKGFISRLCIPYMKFPSLMAQKLWLNLKFIAIEGQIVSLIGQKLNVPEFHFGDIKITLI